MVEKEYPIWDVTQNGEVDIFDLTRIGRRFGDAFYQPECRGKEITDFLNGKGIESS